MPIVDTDLHYRLSVDGAFEDPQPDPFASIGGEMSSTDIVTNVSENLFPNVTGAQSLAGYIDYAGVFALNDHASLTLVGTHLWIQSQPTATGDAQAIGLAAEGMDSAIEVLANRTTTPATVSFSAPANYAAGLVMGDLAAQSYYGFWSRRTISAGTAAYTNDTFQWEFQGDTAA